MKFMPGYKVSSDNSFVDEIIKNKDSIYEVYFAWGDIPNGRNFQLENEGMFPWEAQKKQIDDLTKISHVGIALNLLLNGNCYGKDSQSRDFFNKIGNLIDYIKSQFGLKSITTTSPLIAKFVKNNFSELETRASVNMRIGTVEGMDYISNLFDGYYMQREYNRDFDRIKTLKKWCDDNGKKLYMLANSGCLNFCSSQTFHDNLVSHETEIAAMDNAYEFVGSCREYLKVSEHLNALVYNTNFVRPEDINLYDEFFTAAKLATRVSKKSINILKSYINGRYHGNVLDLLEPSHNIYPYVLENGSPLKLVKLSENLAMYEYKSEDK